MQVNIRFHRASECNVYGTRWNIMLHQSNISMVHIGRFVAIASIATDETTGHGMSTNWRLWELYVRTRTDVIWGMEMWYLTFWGYFNEIRSRYWHYAVSFYTSIWLARRRWTKACICSKSRLLAFRIDQSTGCITVGDNHIERLQQQCKWSETIKSIFPTTTKLFF